ncbi:hypothetical protein Q9L42_013600 [Methylomarinum sp. Ch1-1]|uniref:Uncharacterized protein n=1 Tax=Methylomarinum roseum TaxID=3067653 RepID=A0AAU7NQZ1_9GAMM|nr:hypothetical protein [Methylomarinum sp. Ch1-1]MDP4520648.1 hypothetical protein [Methylomarinum sp. Ch1-1]
MNSKHTITLHEETGPKSYPLTRLAGTLGPDVVDIRPLYRRTGQPEQRL